MVTSEKQPYRYWTARWFAEPGTWERWIRVCVGGCPLMMPDVPPVLSSVNWWVYGPVVLVTVTELRWEKRSGVPAFRVMDVDAPDRTVTISAREPVSTWICMPTVNDVP